MRILRISLMIVITALLFAGALIFTDLAYASEVFEEVGVYTTVATFCIVFGAVSVIGLVETTYREARRGRLSEEGIRALQDWSPISIVLLAAILPMLFWTFLFFLSASSVFPPIVLISAIIVAALLVWVYLKWLFKRR